MKLEAIKYSRFAGDTDEWRMEGKPVNNEYGQWCTLEALAGRCWTRGFSRAVLD